MRHTQTEPSPLLVGFIIIGVIVAGTFSAQTCQAQTDESIRYVTDEFRADLRSIPSERGKITNYLRAGTQLTLLEENQEGWSHVRTGRGTEGWLRSSYLVAQQVARVRIAQVEQRHQQLEKKSQKLNKELQQKDQQLQQLQAQLAQLEKHNSNARKQLTEIKAISGNQLALNDQNQQLLKIKSELESELDSLNAMNHQLENDQRYRWFLYGALAVCLGAALAILLPQIRRKRRYSEWR